MPNVKISELADAGALDGSELVELVQGGGNVKALLSEIAALAGGGEFAVTANVYTAVGGATYTKPAGLAAVLVLVCGGGGSGNVGPVDFSTPPIGGASGAVALSLIAAGSVGSTVTVTVGGGGAARSNASAGAGNAGGASSFGSHCSATGGAGGTVNNGSAAPAGGSASGGSLLNINGFAPNTNGSGMPTTGADAPLGLGFGGNIESLSGFGNAIAPIGYGAGGGGGLQSAANSQAGRPGVVIAISFIQV